MPPCLTQNALSLRSAITLPARHAGIASQLLKDICRIADTLRHLRFFTSAQSARLLSPRPQRPIYRNCVCPAPTIPDSLRNRPPVLLPRRRFKVSQYVNILSPLSRSVKGFHPFLGWLPHRLSSPPEFLFSRSPIIAPSDHCHGPLHASLPDFREICDFRQLQYVLVPDFRCNEKVRQAKHGKNGFFEKYVSIYFNIFIYMYCIANK